MYPDMELVCMSSLRKSISGVVIEGKQNLWKYISWMVRINVLVYTNSNFPDEENMPDFLFMLAWLT